MADALTRMTTKQMADTIYDAAETPQADTDMMRGIIFDLNKRYPDGIPDTELVSAYTKKNPGYSKKIHIIDFAGAASPPAARTEPYVAGQPGNIENLARKATGGASSVTGAVGNLLSGSMTSILEPALPYINKGIEAAVPYTGGAMGTAAAGAAQFAKNVAPPLLRSVGATDTAKTVEGLGQTGQDLITGYTQGMAEAGIDMASPAGFAFLLSGGPMRAMASKLPRAAKVFSALLSGSAATGTTKELIAKELPEAHAALDKADYKGFGRAMAKASADLVIGLDAVRNLKGQKAKFREPGAHLPLSQEVPAGALPAAREVPLGAYPGARPIPAGAFPAARPIPPKPGTEVALRRDPRTGAPVATPRPAESEAQRMLHLSPEELTARRQMAGEQLAALERSATSQSQGGQTATVTLPDGRVQTVSAPEIPVDLRQQIGAARAKVMMLDRVMGKQQSTGAVPPPIRTDSTSGTRQDFPPAARAISTPEGIAVRHGLSVEGPMPPRVGSEAPQGTFNLNQIWRETTGEIQARLAALARDRSAYTDASSPQAVYAERQIAALQDMLTAKRTAEMGGQPVPPVQPMPLDMGAMPAARPAPMGVKPQAGVPVVYEDPSRGVRVGEGTAPRYTGPVDAATMPEGPLYGQPSRQTPGRPAELLPPAVRPESILTPSGTSRVDMKTLAAKHNVDIEALRSVESTPDVEVVGQINRLTNIRAKGVAPDGSPLTEAMKAKMDSIIQAYTELLRGRDPVYREFVRNPPASR